MRRSAPAVGLEMIQNWEKWLILQVGQRANRDLTKFKKIKCEVPLLASNQPHAPEQAGALVAKKASGILGCVRALPAD